MRAALALILALLTLAATHSRAALHPQDGPHVEIRIAIEDDAVRWTSGLNLAFIDEMIEPSRESLQHLTDDEQDALLRRLEAYLVENIRVSIDGEPVRPRVESLDLHADPDPSLVVLFPKMGMRALIRGVAVLAFDTDTPPETVDLTWPTFPEDRVAAEFEQAEQTPLMVLEAQLRAEGTMKIVRFSEADPTVTWHRGWDDAARFTPVPDPPERVQTTRVPALSLAAGAAALASLAWSLASVARGRGWFAPLMTTVIFAAAAVASTGVARVPIPGSAPPQKLDDAEIERAFLALHDNMYKAFDYTAESDVYDSLARSVEGPLLAELYTQVRASLVQAEQGGMLGIVTGIHPGPIEVLGDEDTPAGDMSATLAHTWTIDGTVYHWGHSHTRQIEYEGEYTITALPQGWRITDHRILSQTRLDPGADESPEGVEDLLRAVGGDDI